jgi:RsiW-degrading membrane proteinase PrsW (M82 family)
LILLISLAALGLSCLINRLMLRLFREHAVILGAPVFEEIFKTLPAYYANRSVFHVHFLFGLGEALYDLAAGSQGSGKWAAVFSIISHSLFGLTAEWLLGQTGMILPALLSAMALHFAWNLIVMRMGKKKEKVVD